MLYSCSSVAIVSVLFTTHKIQRYTISLLYLNGTDSSKLLPQCAHGLTTELHADAVRVSSFTASACKGQPKVNQGHYWHHLRHKRHQTHIRRTTDRQRRRQTDRQTDGLSAGRATSTHGIIKILCVGPRTTVSIVPGLHGRSVAVIRAAAGD